MPDTVRYMDAALKAVRPLGCIQPTAGFPSQPCPIGSTRCVEVQLGDSDPFLREDLSASSLESSTLLLRRAHSGDREALDRILSRYYPRLLRWASGRLPGSARSLMDTGDLVQDVILRTVRNFENLEIPEHGGLLPYLRTAVRNLIRDQIRNTARRGETVPVDDLPLANAEPSPLERVVGADLLERYEAALERLRPEDRQAILIRLELDCNWGLVAKELGKPSADAARVATSRALIRLAEEMQHGK